MYCQVQGGGSSFWPRESAHALFILHCLLITISLAWKQVEEGEDGEGNGEVAPTELLRSSSSLAPHVAAASPRQAQLYAPTHPLLLLFPDCGARESVRHWVL